MEGALEHRIRSLEARLNELEDIEEIRQLKARYGDLADRRYARGRPVSADQLEPIANKIASLFTEDAVWNGGSALGTCTGREAIRDRFLAPTLNFSWHYFVKPQIRVDGDRAEARWDVFAPCTTQDDVAMWMAGSEDDEYRRIDGRWLHSRMELRVVFFAPFDRGWAPAKS